MADQIRAADLPKGSVVATADATFIRTDQYPDMPWFGTGACRINSDRVVDDIIDGGGQVLRVGVEPPASELRRLRAVVDSVRTFHALLESEVDDHQGDTEYQQGKEAADKATRERLAEALGLAHPLTAE